MSICYKRYLICLILSHNTVSLISSLLNILCCKSRHALTQNKSQPKRQRTNTFPFSFHIIFLSDYIVMYDYTEGM